MTRTSARGRLPLAGLLLVLVALAPRARASATPTTLLALPGAFQSPWWENYDVRQSFLCPQRGLVVVERNESQASVLAAGVRFTLFREAGAGPELQYRNDDLRLILSGDQLTLEQLPQRLTCFLTDNA